MSHSIKPPSPQEVVERALECSQADGCVVLAHERSETNLRWANNTLTTNGEMRSRSIAVISVVDGQAGAAAGIVERSSISLDRVEDLVRAAEHAAREAGPADDAAPLVEPGADYGAAATQWYDGPAETQASVFSRFAPELGAALSAARAEDRLLFGYAEHAVDTTYLGTSTGLRLRYAQPAGKLELNAKSADRSRSVWGGAATRDFADVDVAGLDADLRTRLAWSDRRVDLPAGRYETLLPPSAVADLLLPLSWSASARDSDEGRTVFSRAGGGTRIGERLTDAPLTLRSDPAAAGLECAPFVAGTASYFSGLSIFDNGAPAPEVRWIDSGTLTALARTRAWAAKTGAEPVLPVGNLILDSPGDGGSLPEMIGATKRGLLLTCLWYIRDVDPQTLLLTGLTRDGVYLVEDGEVTGAVTNFRFNESPVDMLGRVSEAGRTEQTLCREWNDWFNRTAMPPLRVADFNMSTVSQAS